MSADLDIYLMAGFLLALFGTAFVIGACRLAAAADRQQERHIAEIERGASPSLRAPCPWPEKITPFHSTTSSREEQQGAA